MLESIFQFFLYSFAVVGFLRTMLFIAHRGKVNYVTFFSSEAEYKNKKSNFNYGFSVNGFDNKKDFEEVEIAMRKHMREIEKFFEKEEKEKH